MSSKRKSTAEHTSRLHYGAPSSSGDGSSPGGGGGAWEPAPTAGSYPRADPSVLSTRRIVSGSVPVATGAGGRRQDVRSRKHRYQAYRRGFRDLNREFHEWAEGARAGLLADAPGEEVGTDERPPAFFLGAVREYLRRAALLRERYALSHGDVLTFGDGDMGQLGLPDREGEVQAAKRPRLVATLRDRKIVDLAAGGLHCAAVDEDGAVYTWGANDEGQLGQFRFGAGEDQVETAYVPERVRGFKPSRSSPTYPDPDPDPASGADGGAGDEDEAIVCMAAGDCQTLCLSTSGNVYFFGSYKDNEGKMWRDPTPPDETRTALERRVEDAIVAKFLRENTKAKDVATKAETKSDAKDEAVAKEAEQKRNPPAVMGKQMWPVHVYRLPQKAKGIACGMSFNAAHLEDGTLVTWGLGSCGELGRKVRPLRDERTGKVHADAVRDVNMRPMAPVFVDSPNLLRRKVESVGCGKFHLLVVAERGEAGMLAVYSSGLNNFGQLGLGDKVPRQELTRIAALDGLNVHKVAGGFHHSLALDGSGRDLYAFGRGDSGQLGTTDSRPEAGYCKEDPVSVPLERRGGGGDDNDNGGDPAAGGEGEEEEEGPIVSHIACGDYHSLALTEGGDLYTWGFGDTCALGHGRARDEYRPRKVDVTADMKERRQLAVGAVPTVRKIAAGGQFSAIVVTTSEGH